MTTSAAPEIQLTADEARRRERIWRAMPADEQPYLVCFMGMLDYQALSEHPTREQAEAELSRWQAAAQTAQDALRAWQTMNWGEREDLIAAGHTRPEGLRLGVMTSDAAPHEFQVRQQHDLDTLGAAIRSAA